jgi:hypothetical protein
MLMLPCPACSPHCPLPLPLPLPLLVCPLPPPPAHTQESFAKLALGVTRLSNAAPSAQDPVRKHAELHSECGGGVAYMYVGDRAAQ